MQREIDCLREEMNALERDVRAMQEGWKQNVVKNPRLGKHVHSFELVPAHPATPVTSIVSSNAARAESFSSYDVFWGDRFLG